MAEAKPLQVSRHQPGLDGLRGLAILLVMALHFVGDATPQNLGERLVVKVSSYGLLGVDLFFVLSGFLITGLLLDAKGQPHYFRNFYARRTLRIFPLYYAVLAILFLVVPLLATPTPALEAARRQQAWLWTYTANFYIAAKASWALTYASHFWSLAIEEQFYVLWPLVVFAVRRETLERICVGVIVGALGLRIGLALWDVSQLSISVLTPCRADTLCTGALLAALARRESGAEPLLRRAGAAALASAAALIVLSAWCAITHAGLPVLVQIQNSLFALFFGALTLVSVVPPERSRLARVFRGSPLRLFGKYSYGLYVYHVMLSYYMHEIRAEERLTELLGNHSAAMAVKASVGLAISLAVSVASFELLEKPFLALKGLFEGRERALASAAGPAVAPAVTSAAPAREGHPGGGTR